MENTNTPTPDYSGYVPPPPPPPPSPSRRHSSLGIASTAIALVYILVVLVLMMIIISQLNDMPYAGMMGSERQNESVGYIAKFLIGFGVNVNIVGLGIGIAGFFQNGKSKAFAIVGSVIHFMFILLTFFWIISAFSKVPTMGF